MTQICNVSEVRKNIRGVLEAAAERGMVTVVERQGRPMAAVIPWDHYVALYLKASGETPAHPAEAPRAEAENDWRTWVYGGSRNPLKSGK